jgi:two-component system response regulator DegU
VDASNHPINVVVVDDEPLLREAIRGRLATSEQITVVGEGSVGEDILSLVEQLKPDVLILDLNMPQYRQGEFSVRFQALPTISRLSKQYKDMAIIILTVVYQPGMIYGAIDCGVRGYILKSDDMALNIPAAVKQVDQGGFYFSESVEKELFNRGLQQNQPMNLSDRQLEALMLLATDINASYLRHAQTMGISESTFKKHLDEIYKTLGVNNSRAAVIKAMQWGIIPIPSYGPG